MKQLRIVFLDRNGVLRSGWSVTLFVVVSVVCLQLISQVLGGWLKSLEDPTAVVFMVAQLANALLATWIGSLAVRQRFAAAGLSDTRKGTHFCAGCLIAVALMTLAVGVPWLIGQLGMSWPPDGAGALARSGALQLAVPVPGSIAEEIQFRGFLLQQLKRGCGSVVGVSATSVLFGIVHLMNPNGNWIEATIIALVGVWFGILVLGTGSLWLTFGLHTGWNLVEGFVLGQPVSGYTISVPLMRRTHVGSAAWTGGAFGPEGSIWLAILLGIGIVVSLLHFRRQRLAGSARHEPQAVATVES